MGINNVKWKRPKVCTPENIRDEYWTECPFDKPDSGVKSNLHVFFKNEYDIVLLWCADGLLQYKVVQEATKINTLYKKKLEKSTK